MSIGDFFVTKPRDVDLLIREAAIVKQLIRERTDPLELLRELISNSGAQEVGARNIHIIYYVHPEYAHSFEVRDDGCGMNFTNQTACPGRLDRFLGLGLSGIAGLETDEFAWKGLGSKLAYQSRRLEIETCNGKEAYSVVVNEPWQTIDDGKLPRPQVTETELWPNSATGTVVRTFGHPPHKGGAPIPFERIHDYLVHRTYIGFTRERSNAPRITLKVQTRAEEIPFGFPELNLVSTERQEGTVFVTPPVTVHKGVEGSSRKLLLSIKGIYTWDEGKYGLNSSRGNTGLILSVKGVPYLTLNMRDLGSGGLAVANPGVNKCCLIAECDDIQTEMNISRSGLVDSPLTETFRKAATEALSRIENSPEHLAFRQVPIQRKNRKNAVQLGDRKKELERSDQEWVYYQKDETLEPVFLFRRPENETDTLAILWKLEALGALPFKKFASLAYSGSGADLVVEFQEDDMSDTESFATVEVEHRFFNFKAHGHLIPQFPKVVCWEINPRRRMPTKATGKPFKFIVQLDETNLRVFTLSKMPGVKVFTRQDLERRGATRAWASNL